MATTTLTPTSETPKLAKKGSTGDLKGASSTATTFGCPHVKSLLQNGRQPALDAYTRIITSIRDERNFSGSIYRNGGGGGVTTTTGKSVFLCLQCPTVSGKAEKHKNHAFAVESHHGTLLCHDCADFVYDPTLEAIRSPPSKKRSHNTAFPSPGDKRLVATNTTPTPCAAVGLRGLYNMGQTCFMSVILQSLIHNPFVRAWYLGEGHRSSECTIEACTSCALDDIFTDFYGVEKHEGYGAVHMLQGCWKHGGGLAGYSQQDAHEYLGFILNSLHTANTTEGNGGDADADADAEPDDEDAPPAKQQKTDTQNCACITHTTFAGTLASTITCTTCSHTSTTHDPFTDLSLDIRTPSSHTLTKKKKLSLIPGTTTVKETLPMDLTECLDRFTAPEVLEEWHCAKCATKREGKKVLRLASCPPVLPVHLKRFAHSREKGGSSKVDTRIRFPFDLDLGCYTTARGSGKVKPQKPHGKSDNKNGDKDAKSSNASDFGADADADALDPSYTLSSVIVHKGKLDNGHYISYSRLGDEWFRFDDSMVVAVSEREVLGAEAYMLFYVVEGI